MKCISVSVYHNVSVNGVILYNTQILWESYGNSHVWEFGIPTAILWEWDGNGNENSLPTATLSIAPSKPPEEVTATVLYATAIQIVFNVKYTGVPSDTVEHIVSFTVNDTKQKMSSTKSIWIVIIQYFIVLYVEITTIEIGFAHFKH